MPKIIYEARLDDAFSEVRFIKQYAGWTPPDKGRQEGRTVKGGWHL